MGGTYVVPANLSDQHEVRCCHHVSAISRLSAWSALPKRAYLNINHTRRSCTGSSAASSLCLSPKQLRDGRIYNGDWARLRRTVHKLMNGAAHPARKFWVLLSHALGAATPGVRSEQALPLRIVMGQRCSNIPD